MLHVGSSSANVDSLALRVQDSDGNCAFNPESVDTAWTCSSDARAKTNIKDATSVMPYLLGIPIRDYTVIASGDNKTEVIAQELLEKYPELVHEDNDLNFSLFKWANNLISQELASVFHQFS